MVLQKIQFILANGRPQWAVLPIEDYTRLCEQEQALKQILAHPPQTEAPILPASLQSRLALGESPIRLWREYKNLSQQDLAKAAGISVPYLSQLENKLRSGSKEVLKALAQALGVNLELIVN